MESLIKLDRIRREELGGQQKWEKNQRDKLEKGA